MTPEAMEALVRRYFAATRAMDLEAWLACFAEDAISHDPYGAPPTQGKAGLREFFLNVAGVFREIGFTEEFVNVTGNRAAVKFSVRGIGKNGRAVTGEGIDVFEFNDRGTIQTMWGYWDPAALIARRQA
ncbi:MAG: nuclear transport factor 2 family protein [Nitrospiraceae bacterium]